METTTISLNKQLIEQASIYAKQHGTNLPYIIESYLSRLISQTKTEEKIPDIVQSLLGAGESVEADDINGRNAYYRYLEEKYH